MTKEELLEIAKPILFNTEMTKAIMDGRKVQTRRVLKSVKDAGVEFKRFRIEKDAMICEWSDNKRAKRLKQPLEKFIKQESKYQIGDILWVREPAETIRFMTRAMDKNIALEYMYKADGIKKWINLPDRIKNGRSLWYLDRGRGMPNGCIKEMARIFLRVTNVRVERLWDMRKNDASFVKEGFYREDERKGIVAGRDEIVRFQTLWDAIAKDGCKWNDNPYVFVYEFEIVEIER